MTDTQLYEDGEEKFGLISSAFYSIFSKFLVPFYEEINADLKDENFKSILDVGCGPGYLDLILAKTHPDATFYMVDPSPAMISIARKRVEKAHLGRRFFVELGSSRNIPFDVKFDSIISSFSYHHWNNRDDSLKFLASRLNLEGLLAIYEYHTSGGLIGTSHGVSVSAWSNFSIEGFKKEIKKSSKLIALRLRRIF
ncbi:MAG: class I SAM-dependent methyltransferase [Thermoplasmatales archaeon]